jgi:hypothetical protein
MTPLQYNARILADGHLPLPAGFSARAGDEVLVTLTPLAPEDDASIARRQWDRVAREIEGRVASGLPDVAEHHDDHLYGDQDRR